MLKKPLQIAKHRWVYALEIGEDGLNANHVSVHGSGKVNV